MAPVPSPRFHACWLVWNVEREDRHLRIYVVEPASPSAKQLPLFRAALERFMVAPTSAGYLSERWRAEGHHPQTERFDLLLFPEIFLSATELVDTLVLIGGKSVRIGCVHLGLRPSEIDASGGHLFTTDQAKELLALLGGISNACPEDFRAFGAWLDAQPSDGRFNLGCLFTVDAAQRLRVCLHPKLVRSPMEHSTLHEHHMTEANFLSLVTLKATSKNLSSLTIQPLLCSDVLNLPTDALSHSPIDAVTTDRGCFGEVHSDHVDVVSVATCTRSAGSDFADPEPQPECRFAWHQRFREAFVRAAQEDQCYRHHGAVFVLSNYRVIRLESGGKGRWGGLSGAFLPLPIHGSPYVDCISRSDAVYGHFPAGSDSGRSRDDDRWVDGDEDVLTEPGASTLGHIVGIAPTAHDGAARALMFGFTLRRVPREANRWHRLPSVSDFVIYDAVLRIEHDQERLRFNRRERT